MEETKVDERLKPIDRTSIIKGYQDKDFQDNEKKCLELLQNAVEFIK